MMCQTPYIECLCFDIGELRQRLSLVVHKANQSMLLERVQMVGDGAQLAGRRRKWDRLEEERGKWVRQANWMARVTGPSLVRKDRIGGKLE